MNIDRSVTVVVERKSIFKSKTFWLNAVALGIVGGQWALGHKYISDIDVAAITGVDNIIVRFWTKAPVSVTGN